MLLQFLQQMCYVYMMIDPNCFFFRQGSWGLERLGSLLRVVLLWVVINATQFLICLNAASVSLCWFTSHPQGSLVIYTWGHSRAWSWNCLHLPSDSLTLSLAFIFLWFHILTRIDASDPILFWWSSEFSLSLFNSLAFPCSILLCSYPWLCGPSYLGCKYQMQF